MFLFRSDWPLFRPAAPLVWGNVWLGQWVGQRDFGALGVWNVDTAGTWTQISGGDAESLTDVDLY